MSGKYPASRAIRSESVQMRAIILLAALTLSACSNTHHYVSRPQSAIQELPPAQNVADLGTLTVSGGQWNKHFAIDGNEETWWSADAFAPQWLEIDFVYTQSVEKVRFTVAQVSPGPATHKIRMEDKSGKVVLWHRFDAKFASDGDTFVLRLDPPQFIDKIRITTTKHPGWVAYREVRIEGSDSLPTSVSAVTTGLFKPVFLTHVADGSGRLFILEQEGQIRLVREGVLLPEPFLDISQKVSVTAHNGLLGLAFPPDYEEKGMFYITYVSADSKNTISRFFVSSDNPDVADPYSEEVILSFDQPAVSHSAGPIAFGPHDGLLYVAVGDGRVSSIPRPLTAQETDNLHGKILRIDVSPGARPYAIPSDNPFIETDNYAPEIWASGLRNPWGIAFDQETGALFIPDTGHAAKEEVSYQPPDSTGGQNYGWPCFEGDSLTGDCDLDGSTFPVVSYGRDLGCAVVGGAVYRGRFIYADFCQGDIWALSSNSRSEWKAVPFTRIKALISSVGADEEGNLYALSYADGTVYRLEKLN